MTTDLQGWFINLTDNYLYARFILTIWSATLTEIVIKQLRALHHVMAERFLEVREVGEIVGKEESWERKHARKNDLIYR
jgi:hypothetical protein